MITGRRLHGSYLYITPTIPRSPAITNVYIHITVLELNIPFQLFDRPVQIHLTDIQS